MPTSVERIDTEEGWDAAVPIIRQLWSHEDEEFVRSWREEDDYQLYGLYDTAADDPDHDDLVAVAGVSIQRVLHHVRHAWIHDFVVDEPYRGEGNGAALLAWVEDWARERDCEYVALACTDENDAGREFYEAQELAVWGQVMEREL